MSEATVQITIEAIDKYTKPLEDANKKVKKTGEISTQTIKATWKEIRELAAGAVAASAALYGIAQGIDAIAERGAKLGNADALKSVNAVKDQMQELVDQLLTTNLPTGGTVLDLIKNLADGLTIALREVGVILQGAAAGFQLVANDAKYAFSQIQLLVTGTESYTKAAHDAEQAQILQTTATRIGIIWEGKLTETYEESARSLKGLQTQQNATHKSLAQMIADNKKLNQEYSKRRAIEDAIRAGDARALADARAGGSFGGFRSGGSGSGATANGGRGGGPNMAVQVFVGNEAVDARVRTVYANEVVKPAMKGGGGTGGKR